MSNLIGKTIEVRFDPLSNFDMDEIIGEIETLRGSQRLSLNNKAHLTSLAKWMKGYFERKLNEFVKLLEHGYEAQNHSTNPELTPQQIRRKNTGAIVQMLDGVIIQSNRDTNTNEYFDGGNKHK